MYIGQPHTVVSIVNPVQPPASSDMAELPQSALNETSKPGTLSAVSLTLDTSSYSSRHNACDGHVHIVTVDVLHTLATEIRYKILNPATFISLVLQLYLHCTINERMYTYTHKWTHSVALCQCINQIL